MTVIIKRINLWPLIKRRGAYFILPVIGAALISTTGETLRGIYRELSEARTSRYAQFNIEYVHLELLYEPGFKSFPTLKNFRTHKLVEVLFLKQYGFDISLYQAAP